VMKCTTRDGHPISYLLRGRMQVDDLTKRITPSQYEGFIAYERAAHMRYVNKISRQAGRYLGIYVVTDLEGLSTNMIGFGPYLKVEFAYLERHAPEVLVCHLMVNAPSLYYLLMMIMNPLMGKRTASRTHVEKGKANSLNRIREFDELEDIPMILGGLDPCPELQVPDPWNGLTPVRIKAGSAFVDQIVCPKPAMACSWQFAVMDKTIEFEAVFAGDDGSQTVVEKNRCVKAADGIRVYSFTSKVGGVLMLKWDNSKAYYNSKLVMYCVGEFTVAEQFDRKSEFEESG